jgi:hypothetical protein
MAVGKTVQCADKRHGLAGSLPPQCENLGRENGAISDLAE